MLNRTYDACTATFGWFVYLAYCCKGVEVLRRPFSRHAVRETILSDPENRRFDQMAKPL